MRIFLSLNPDNEVLEELKKMQDKIKEELGFTESFKIKWEHYSKFHITMFFLGETDETKLPGITESLRRIKNEGIGEIHFDEGEFGAFPIMKNPRVLVCKLNNPDEKVFTLNEKIAETLSGHGFAQDNKFRPHITLGRAKKNHSPNIMNLKPKKFKRSFSIRELMVVKSVLSFKGSEYEVLERIEL
jgi:RNA 2',3'-cyclic 3'-phosphodiesterase